MKCQKLRELLKEKAVISIGNAQIIYPLIDELEAVSDKLETENKFWVEQYHIETNRLSRELVVRGKKLEAISILLTGTCESYDEGHCEPDCDGDADYEHCLTRKILEVLGN